MTPLLPGEVGVWAQLSLLAIIAVCPFRLSAACRFCSVPVGFLLSCRPSTLALPRPVPPGLRCFSLSTPAAIDRGSLAVSGGPLSVCRWFACLTPPSRRRPRLLSPPARSLSPVAPYLSAGCSLV